MRAGVLRPALLLSFFFLISSVALGTEYRVTGFEGEVTVRREGRKSGKIENGEVLKMGDAVTTKRDSFLTLRTETGYYKIFPYSFVRLREEPQIVWGKLASSPDTGFMDVGFYFYPSPAQGRTMKVRLLAGGEKLSISSYIRNGKGFKKELNFFPFEEGGYRALTGFDVGLLPDKYRLQILVREGESATLIVYPFYLKAPRYGRGRVYIEREKTELFSPSETKKKQQQELAAVLSARSEQARWMGKFRYPVQEPEVISGFGKKRIYYIGNKESMVRYHRGIDFKGDIGDPVLSPGEGEVVLAAERITTGYTLVIDHGHGVFSLFFHLDSISVPVGTAVKKGSVIAEIGATGITEGSHLHWGMYVDGVYVDPVDWIRMKF